MGGRSVPDNPIQPLPAASRRRVLVLGAAVTVAGAGALAACGSGTAPLVAATEPVTAGGAADPALPPTDSPASDAGLSASEAGADPAPPSTPAGRAAGRASKSAAPSTSKKAKAGASTKARKPAQDFSQGALAKLSAVPVGGSAVVAGVAIGRPSSKKVVGHSTVCTHAGCAVKAAGAALNCPCHGSVFDAFSGAVQEGPAEAPLPGVRLVIKGDYIHRA
jgi:Rieske Fe-S protein